MGRGLSPLQHDILAAIKAKRVWVRSKEIRKAIGRGPTDSNIVAVSKALGRLCKRGLIERGNREIMNVGKPYLYRWPRKP
jgi:predicted transcriptional regulator